MGAWGVSGFDNDDANDWADGLERVADLSLVLSAFASAENADEYLEARDGCNAIAACEVVARLRGNFGYQNPYTAKVDTWVKQHPLVPPRELRERAVSVLDRVLGERSELRDLWGEGDATEWLESVEDLRHRLLD